MNKYTKSTDDKPYRFISFGRTRPKKFSICSLVQSEERYKTVVNSAISANFSVDNCEFIAIDNREGPKYDGYTWIREVITESTGDYIVFTHDDIEFTNDGFQELFDRLEELERHDPTWMIAGVAGGPYKSTSSKKDVVYRISDMHGTGRRVGNFPHRVETLDECFFVMKRDRFVVPSINLSGFHFFGSDLCLLAEVMGGSAYVIDFLLTHHGDGARDITFRTGKRRLKAKYSPFFPDRILHTTTTIIRF